MNSPNFLHSAIEAIQQKVDDQSLSLLVSIEDDSPFFDEFWSDPLLLSSLNSTFLIVRLSTPTDSDEISQFQELYDVPSIPCLLYFSPNSDSPTRTWHSNFPTIEEFYGYFISKIEMPLIGHRPISPQSLRSSKVSLTFGSAKFITEFPPNATIGDLRVWARSQISVNCRFIVSLNGLELPEDDKMTLTAADFVPSVALRAEPIEQLREEEELPSLVTDVETMEIRPLEVIHTIPIGRRIRNLLKRICDFLNPWTDVIEVEDFFAVKDE
jgi:hypothetical protein